jgi:tyrosinase
MANGLVLTRYDITDLNNGKIAEYPVDNPPGWDDISLYYAKALQQMGWLDSPDGDQDVTSMWKYSEEPNSYFFQGAMHWWPKYPGGFPPSPYDAWWSHCTHEANVPEQYFLPWHRAYIYCYEILIRAEVAKLGGPEGWAIPHWNYSYNDPSNPVPWPRSNLPWVFAQPKLPDGSTNPLYIADTVKRGLQPEWPDPPGGGPMYLEFTTPNYANAYALPSYFDFNSSLDQTPHGMTHVDVGTGDQVISQTGWMADPVTAGFDPIFWLHHSQIDRFWVGWNGQGNKNPTNDQTWLKASDDPRVKVRWNFWQDGDIDNVLRILPGDMLDPATLSGSQFPYTYNYDTLPEVPPPNPPGPVALAGSQPKLAFAGPSGGGGGPRELAASEGPVQLAHEPVTASVPLGSEAPQALANLDSAAPDEAPRVVLHLEGVVSDGPGTNYDVYVNYPDADSETAGSVPHYVGSLSGFGTAHEHGEGDDAEPHGMNAKYDITPLVNHLRSEGEWDESQVKVTFVPAVRPREGMTIVTAPLKVGKISIRSA